ncbi:MAG: hypothetical protein PHU40_01815 [Sulfurimonas sp.]|nr:hypothetical protein [Sulfurimonas sp.]
MTQIKHTNLDELAKKYSSKIHLYINQKDTKYKLDGIICDLLQLFDKNLEQIITSKPSEIRKLIKKSPDTFSKNIEQLKDLYTVFRNKWGVELIEDLNLKVCPFCNREYIFKFEDTKQKKARILASLDHFYDKDSYPFLSVSFFNLIPSCTICNSKFKHTKNFYTNQHLHPYEDDFNKKAKFTHFFNVANDENKHYSILSKQRINLDLKRVNDSDMKTKNTIETFRLKELYNEHKDIVLELIQKAEIYNDSYIDELMQKYEGTLFKNREDLMRLITCGYVSDEDLHKRPLSKLIKDISEELGLV